MHRSEPSPQPSRSQAPVRAVVNRTSNAGTVARWLTALMAASLLAVACGKQEEPIDEMPAEQLQAAEDQTPQAEPGAEGSETVDEDAIGDAELDALEAAEGEDGAEEETIQPDPNALH